MSIEVDYMVTQRIHHGEIVIPENIEVKLDEDGVLLISGPLGEVRKDFRKVPVKFSLENGKIKFMIHMKGKKGASLVNTIRNRINNVFVGVTKGYTYRMKVFYIHFPMTVEVNGDYVIIKNFAGERGIRRAKIMPGVKVEVIKKGGDTDVIVKGIDKDMVGQTAANIYLATKIKSKDPRVFLDGIYVYYKGEGVDEW